MADALFPINNGIFLSNKRKHKISPKDIKFISFEGGGGKGSAYLGALWALEKLKILCWSKNSKTGGYRLNSIDGISGSSAGAITAMLLATGYTIPKITVKLAKVLTAQNNKVVMPEWVKSNPIFKLISDTLEEKFSVNGMFDPPFFLSENENPDIETSREEMRIVARNPITGVLSPYYSADCLENLNLPKGEILTREIAKAWQVVRKLPKIQSLNKSLLLTLKYESYNHDPGVKDQNDIHQKAFRKSQFRLPRSKWTSSNSVPSCVPDFSLSKLVKIGSFIFDNVYTPILKPIKNGVASAKGFLLGLFVDQKKNEKEEILLSLDRYPILKIKMSLFFDRLEKVQKTINKGKDSNAELSEKDEPFNTINNYFDDYLWNWEEDGGFFSGWNARKTLDDLIAEKSNGIKNLTFSQHFELHGVELIVTGTEMKTSRSVYFSAKNTPSFCVADAVRISMGFPVIYKPVRILNGPLSGLWSDGGIMNNTPIHAFDDKKGKINNNVLSLCLDLVPPEIPDSFLCEKSKGKHSHNYSGYEVFNSLLKLLGSGGEWSQVRGSEREEIMNHTIMLDTSGLSTLDFNISRDILQTVSELSYETVMKWFGENINHENILPGLK